MISVIFILFGAFLASFAFAPVNVGTWTGLAVAAIGAAFFGHGLGRIVRAIRTDASANARALRVGRCLFNWVALLTAPVWVVPLVIGVSIQSRDYKWMTGADVLLDI